MNVRACLYNGNFSLFCASNETINKIRQFVRPRWLQNNWDNVNVIDSHTATTNTIIDNVSYIPNLGVTDYIVSPIGTTNE